LLAGGDLAGGGLGVGGGLVGDAAQGGGLGDPGQGVGRLGAFEVGDRAGEGGEDAALTSPGVHAHGHEQAQRFAPAGAGLDLDGAGGDGGEDGKGEHAGQIRRGLGGGGDRGHVLAQPARQGLNRERWHLVGGAEGDGRLPAALAGCGGAGVGQLAGEVGQHGRVGVGVGQLDAEVNDPPAAGRLGYQLGVVAGVGHGGYSLHEGVEERTSAHVGQLAGVVQLPEQGDRVGGLAAVGQAQHGPPDGSVGWPVEVGLLEDGSDVLEQPPGRQERAEDGLFCFQVVRWRPVRLGHGPQVAPGRRPAPIGSGHRRGLRGPLPRRRDLGVGRRWSRMCLT
jgi:hypothetical protein